MFLDVLHAVKGTREECASILKASLRWACAWHEEAALLTYLAWSQAGLDVCQRLGVCSGLPLMCSAWENVIVKINCFFCDSLSCSVR